MFRDKDEFIKLFTDKYAEIEGKPYGDGSAWEHYNTLVQLIKERVALNWAEQNKEPERQVYYFSMEFLIGRLLPLYLGNLGITNVVEDGLGELGISLKEIEKQEKDAGLGNGGLGRLAACFLDSLASLDVAGHGNCIRYRYGIFEQRIIDGKQAELTDNWLENGYPWETCKPGKAVEVRFKGYIRSEHIDGNTVFFHEGYETIRAIPYDVPVVGYDGQSRMNNLRLWSAEPAEQELDVISLSGDNYTEAIRYKAEVEAISDILYPEDSSRAGKELRLKQQYFFVAAGLSSIIRHYKENHKEPLRNLSRWVSIHVNDTHPVLCIPELMRILMDEEYMSWEEAWTITVNTISFTNHTVMPEALEKWPVSIFQYLMPRIYQIIEEIDNRFKEEITRKFPTDWDLLNKVGIIWNHEVRMVDLALIGSHSVNGVSELHTQILKDRVLHRYYRLYPYKFNNKTNGVSHRRFLMDANKNLSGLITEAIGPEWQADMTQLQRLMYFHNDASFIESLRNVKLANKQNLSRLIMNRKGLLIDPQSSFDIQVKRFHAYKRQLLNILRIMDLYLRLRDNPDLPIPSQTFIFGGKAAPGYNYAKEIIQLIVEVANIINKDRRVCERLKVIFWENFNVSSAELLYPAADVSVQISTAGKEASGTGNMKFMMNGALTFGTMDGANVEIHQEVGDENSIIFGLRADEVLELNLNRSYNGWDEYEKHPRLKKVMDLLVDGFFFPESHGRFQGIYDSLLKEYDEYFVLKDFSPCVEASAHMNNLFLDQYQWHRSALVNIANSGIFSSDRTIREYCSGIWHVPCKEIALHESGRFEGS
ncbi:MAG: glycogen/starch/alpha-glucan phosphorylase [Coriobacteriia bacterium]|nr:glycogen/starch/alpha-glucan phosphorylase [Coriobacteriia bacterium]